jgi:putative spermidine/putrescine transport system permease protein
MTILSIVRERIRPYRLRLNWSLLLSVLPGLLLILVFFVVPLWRMVTLSFVDDFRHPTTFTLENYVRILTTSFHLRSFLTSIRLSAIVTVLTALVGYPVAYFLVRSDSRFKSLVFIAIISPLLISLVVRSLGWLMLLGRRGVINGFLLRVGIIDEPLQLIYTFGAVVVGMVHILLPFMVLSITSVLSQVPATLEEAAAILGASPWRRFVRVTLPLSLPGLLAGSFLVFTLTMGSYITPQMLGGGRVNVVTLDIIDRMLVVFDWPLGSALAVSLMILTLLAAVIMVFIQRRFGGTVGGN